MNVILTYQIIFLFSTTPVTSPQQYHRPLRRQNLHSSREDDEDPDTAYKLQQISKQLREHQMKQQRQQMEQFQSTGSARSTCSSVFFSDDQNLLLPAQSLSYEPEEKITSKPLQKPMHLAYSSSDSTLRLALENPDSPIAEKSMAPNIPSTLALISSSVGTSSGVSVAVTGSHPHIFSSSKSLLSLFGSKGAPSLERVPTESSGSASCMVEFSNRGRAAPYSGLFSNTGMRSSTTVLDSINRRELPVIVSSAHSGRSGRIEIDSVIRRPLVNQRSAQERLQYPEGSQTLQHPTARSTRSGIYQSFNEPLSPREGVYRRRRSFDEDEFNYGEHLPYHPREFTGKDSRRCK